MFGVVLGVTYLSLEVPYIDMLIPKWKQTLFGFHFHMGMCLSSYPFGNHHMEMGSRVSGLPIWKRGFPYGNGDFQGMRKSPFPYGDGDFHMETGSHFIVLPIWKRGFPYGNGDFQFAIWKRGAISFSSMWKQRFPYGNG